MPKIGGKTCTEGNSSTRLARIRDLRPSYPSLILVCGNVVDRDGGLHVTSPLPD